MKSQRVDLRIDARWIIPIEPHGLTLANHAVLLDAGRIIDLLPAVDATARYQADKHVSLPEHVLLPGLVNAHTHAAMSLLRGYADDLTLMDWLNLRIWPAETAHVDWSFVHDGTSLACIEMLRGGVTCASDMYFFPDAACAAARKIGLRLVAGIVVIDLPTRYASDADDYLRKGIECLDQYRDDPLIRFTLAPHSPYTVSDTTLERVAMLSAQLDLPVHIHVHETIKEIDDGVALHAMRPIARLHALGLLGPQTIAVHAVHLNDLEIELLARTGTSVVHCPTSNMKLASGIAPIAALTAAGVNVALGTDGAASNNRLDILGEARLAALLAKVDTGDATRLPAYQILRMATLAGAQAVGLDEQIGSIESGKQADLIAIRLDATEMQPCYDPASHVVFVAGREQVSDIWIGGERRMEDGVLLCESNAATVRTARMWQNRLARK